MSELREFEARNERYTFIAQLGHGGMGDVYLAVQRGIGEFRRLSVIKRLRDDLSLDRECVAMFLEEARLAARLCHPNIVHTYEAGFESGHHYIAMEYLNGMSFEDAITRVGSSKFDFAVALRILIDTLSGLEYVHNLSDFDGNPMHLVHRDVSPPNIFVTYDGQIKVLDFGIAKAIGSAVQTRMGSLKGKIPYMAPEQACARKVDARADLYAVGVMLWEAAAGRARWSDFGEVSLLKKVATPGEVIPPYAGSRGLPARTDEICQKALAYDPDERYQTAAEFRAALESLLQDTGRRVSSRDAGAYLARHAKKHTQWLEPLIQSALRVDAHSQVSIRAVTMEVRETPRPTPVSRSRSQAKTVVVNPPKHALFSKLQRTITAQRLMLASACFLGLTLGIRFLAFNERAAASTAAPMHASQPPPVALQTGIHSAKPEALADPPPPPPPEPVEEMRTVTPDELALAPRAKMKAKPRANARRSKPAQAAYQAASATRTQPSQRPKVKSIRLDPRNPW